MIDYFKLEMFTFLQQALKQGPNKRGANSGRPECTTNSCMQRTRPMSEATSLMTGLVRPLLASWTMTCQIESPPSRPPPPTSASPQPASCPPAANPQIFRDSNPYLCLDLVSKITISLGWMLRWKKENLVLNLFSYIKLRSVFISHSLVLFFWAFFLAR